MGPDIPWYLLEKYFAGEMTDAEKLIINEWLSNVPENKMIFEQLKNHYFATGSLPIEFVPDKKEAFKKVSERLHPQHKAKINLITRWVKVAAFLLLLIGSLWLLKAILSSEDKILSYATSRDFQIDSLVLSDGSRIWLNKGSRLSCPKEFKGNREVFLKGEGYFEIKHDPSHPFIVHTSKTTVKVLGTKFDICAYKNENKVTVSVTEGKVSFSESSDNQINLSKGQMSTFDKESGLFEKPTDVDRNVLSWKTKEFIFENDPLESVFKLLSKVYPIEYHFENQAVKYRRITTTLSHLSMDKILEIMALATNTNIRFNKEDAIKLSSNMEHHKKLIITIK